MPWIKYKYSCQMQKDGRSLCDKPLITVELSHGDRVFSFVGLIDSGCTVNQANAEIAPLLGIDLAKAPQTSTIGVGGISKGFVSKVNMKVENFDQKFNAPIIFTENLPVPLLLGQDNFFDRFKIKFEKCNKIFELSLA